MMHALWQIVNGVGGLLLLGRYVFLEYKRQMFLHQVRMIERDHQ